MPRPAAQQHLRPLFVSVLALLVVVALFVASSARGTAPLAAQTCSWNGTWRTSSAGAVMTLSQSGNQVTGDDGNSDQLMGTVSGSQFAGRWSHGSDNGPFAITMDSSCNKFTGTFGHNHAPDGSGGDPFSGTRLSSAPAATATPAPATATPAPAPVNPAPATAAPAAGSGTDLGGLDVASYCRALVLDGFQLFDDAALYDDGVWYCIITDPLGLGLDVAVSVDDLSAVCQWQYGLPNAFARQRVLGDPTSWRCFA